MKRLEKKPYSHTRFDERLPTSTATPECRTLFYNRTSTSPMVLIRSFLISASLQGKKISSTIVSIVLVAFVLYLLSGCTTRREPMVQFSDRPYNLLTPQNMAHQLPIVFRRIREREPSTKWYVVSESQESVYVQCSWRRNTFVVEILLKESGYNVRYVSSQNLNADAGGDGQIYYGYNKLLNYFM